MRDIAVGIILILLGLYTTVSSIKDLNFFMSNKIAKFWVIRFGRKWARYFYIYIGFSLIIYGIIIIIGVIA